MQRDYEKLLENGFSFWNKLKESEQKELKENIHFSTYEKGSEIHNSDSDCLGVSLITKGQLRVYILSEDGRDITLYRLYQGDVCILTASCVIEAITFDLFIEATEDTELMIVQTAAFKRLREQNIYVDHYTYQLTTDRFSDVMWTMQQILFMSMDQRLAVFLADEISKNHSLEIKLTHEEIAKFIGSSREVVTRVLKYFSREGIVELSRGCIKVMDKNKLRNMT